MKSSAGASGAGKWVRRRGCQAHTRLIIIINIIKIIEIIMEIVIIIIIYDYDHLCFCCLDEDTTMMIRKMQKKGMMI